MNVLTLLGAIVLASVPSPRAGGADPIVIGGVPYVQSGPCESLLASFTAPTGGITKGLYSGFVRLTVAGSGESFFTALNDAFYRYTGKAHNPIPPQHDPQHYQLNVAGAPLVAYPDPGYDTQQAYHKVYFDLDAGIEVTPDYTPAYRADHTYTLVIDTGLDHPGPLYFGVADGVFSDNSGAYAIEVCQLVDARPVVHCGQPMVLWPPDHDLIDVGSAFSVSNPDGSAAPYTIRVFSDEPEAPQRGDGAGNFAPDFKDEHDGGRGVLVRAERQGIGNGRFYLGVITATNDYGSTTVECVLAVAPHDGSAGALAAVLQESATGDAPWEHGLARPVGPKQ